MSSKVLPLNLIYSVTFRKWQEIGVVFKVRGTTSAKRAPKCRSTRGDVQVSQVTAHLTVTQQLVILRCKISRTEEAKIFSLDLRRT